jgi:hypothetical protein
MHGRENKFMKRVGWKTKPRFEDIGTDGRIILKWISRK